MKALLIWPVLPNSLAGKMYLSSQNFDDRIFLKKPFNFLNLVDLLCYRENYQPDDIAFTFLSNGEAEEVSLTYQELGKRARAIATVLQSTKARGERALLLYQPGLEFIEAFFAVLLDTWYATKDLMLFIESLKKVYYCPLKDNRQVDDSSGQHTYQRVDSLSWSEDELQGGKRLKIKGFPKDHKVPCFRVEVSTHRTDFVVTNDLAPTSIEATQQACGFRWKIEQLHREGKQVTGLEACQCRKARIQRNHIGCAFLVWVNLKGVATRTTQTVYQLKHGLLDDYLCQQLKNPSLKMSLA